MFYRRQQFIKRETIGSMKSGNTSSAPRLASCSGLVSVFGSLWPAMFAPALTVSPRSESMNETSAFRALAGALVTQANQADSEAIIQRVRVDFAAIAVRSDRSESLHHHVWTALPALVLLSCMQYYNEVRRQLSLAKDARFHVQFRPLGEFYRGKFSGASTTTTSGL
jgi:hypothetical protein